MLISLEVRLSIILFETRTTGQIIFESLSTYSTSPNISNADVDGSSYIVDCEVGLGSLELEPPRPVMPHNYTEHIKVNHPVIYLSILDNTE